jgi:polysaccharide pyruvyl transferase WcaK-like protein
MVKARPMTENSLSRRTFLASLMATTLASALRADEKKSPKILLRSSWQTVNIGDIAHTPGVLRLLEEHIPQAQVFLWPSNINNGVEELLKARFPKLIILKGEAEIKQAFAECDFLLHGSGPSLVAQKDVMRWSKETGKPYGVYGITFSARDSTATKDAADTALAQTIQTLSGAKFAFFRDSISLQLAKDKGCTCPIMEFGPDGAFATDLRDDAKADAFLKAHGLEDGKFLCCIARLRYTPYWKMKPGVAFDENKNARNEAMKEHDIAPLRESVIAVVRQTPMKVLLCPEDSSQMEVNRENIYDKLPDDVKPKVVWRPDYWLTGEALSTYVRSAGLFGLEMHSPIMCIGNGIPAIVCRFAEQTSKGLMWRDIGLGDWLFDLDKEEEAQRVVPAVLALAQDPEGAKVKANKAREFVRQRQRETMAIVAKAAGV